MLRGVHYDAYERENNKLDKLTFLTILLVMPYPLYFFCILLMELEWSGQKRGRGASGTHVGRSGHRLNFEEDGDTCRSEISSWCVS
jgi:hypothetical protein